MYLSGILLFLSLAQSPNLAGGQIQDNSLSTVDMSQLQSKAEAGDAASQLALAKAYQDGAGVPRNDALAAQWYRKSADQGNAVAQNSLGTMYRIGAGVEKNKDQAVAWYKKAANQGNANAMFNLGTSYYNGDGVPDNIFTAYDWFLLAEDAGSPNAIEAVQRTTSELSGHPKQRAYLEIAQMYEQGSDLPQSYSAAAKWYRMAVSENSSVAMVRLAALYIDGRGVKRDYSEARTLCANAAKESAAAQYCLGYINQHGLGSAPDFKDAVVWYRKAADGGHPAAMLELGKMYWKAEGVPSDSAEAYLWLAKAYLTGEKTAQPLAQQVEKEMTLEDSKRLDKKLKQQHVDRKKLAEALQDPDPPTRQVLPLKK